MFYVYKNANVNDMIMVMSYVLFFLSFLLFIILRKQRFIRLFFYSLNLDFPNYNGTTNTLYLTNTSGFAFRIANENLKFL